MDKESLIHHPLYLNALHLCLPPQVHPITTARPPAPLRHLQPPTTTSSPRCTRQTRPRVRLESFASAGTSDQGPRHESQKWMWTLDSADERAPLFLLSTSYHTYWCYLFVITDTITQSNSDSCTFTHCQHCNPPRACFQTLSQPPHIKDAYFQYTELSNAVFGQRLSFSHICNLTPLIQWIQICNSFILNYACFCLQCFLSCHHKPIPFPDLCLLANSFCDSFSL